MDTNATNDITNLNFSSTLFTLFPNIDTNASNDVDLLQDAVLIGSEAGKNVYSENIWFGYQNFNRASASLFEVETNGKIQFNGGVLPAIVDNSVYSYDDVIYFQENPIAILSDYNLASINNKFAFFTTNAFGKLQLGGASEIDVNNLTNALSISASNITMALGYTPLKNTSDTMSGSLTILQTLSSQDLIVSNSLLVGDYVNSAYTLQIEPKVGSLDRRIVLDLLSGSQTETTLGMYIQSVKFSAPSSSELKNITFNQISSTNDLIVDFLKAGTLPSVLNGVLDTYNSQVSAASLYLAANTTNTPQIRFTSSAGIDLSSPTSGDLWFNGTELNFYNGSETVNLLSNSINYFGTRIFSNANTALADGDYIEVSHNANTYDVIATGWVFNNITSKWEQISTDQGSNVSVDLMEYSTDELANVTYTSGSETIKTASGGLIYFTDSTGLNSSATPYIDGYVVHVFTEGVNQIFQSDFDLSESTYLVVGGGGSGGRLNGGGGGGADVVSSPTSAITLASGTYTISVGNGGASVPYIASATSARGNNGGNSTFSGPGISTVASGGCGGAGWQTNGLTCYGNGGGQGGSTGVANTSDASNYNGGARSSFNAGGGGGMGGVGQNASGSGGGNGGPGVISTISGATVVYGAGGGGGGDNGDPGGIGGSSSVGGNGGQVPNAAEAGDSGTGSGGGGGAYSATLTRSYASGAGGDGTVIIRYKYVGNSLKAYSEDTIKNEGSYSLKIEAGNDSLGTFLTKTFASGTLNLSYQDKIIFYMRSSRVGANVSLSLTDNGGTVNTYTPVIGTANIWERFVWDISGDPLEKDNISSFKITMKNTDEGNTFYLDDITTNNSYKILLADANTSRLYNYSGYTQNMRLVVSAESSNLLEYALGYTPLRNDSDYMRGSLGVNDSFSAASARFSNLFATNFSATTGNITNLSIDSFSGSSGFLTNFGVTDSFSAANIGVSTALSAANGSFTNLNISSFSGTSGFLTNFGVTDNFSAASATLSSALILGNLTASNPAGNTRLNLVSNGGSGNNIELGFYNGANKLANFAMDSTNTFEFEGASGVDVHFNTTDGAYRYWVNGSNKFSVESTGQVFVGADTASPSFNLGSNTQYLVVTNRGRSSVGLNQGISGILFNDSHAAANLRNTYAIQRGSSFFIGAVNDTFDASFAGFQLLNGVINGVPRPISINLDSYYEINNKIDNVLITQTNYLGEYVLRSGSNTAASSLFAYSGYINTTGNMVRFAGSDASCTGNPQTSGFVWTCSSDIALKSNIADSTNAIGTLSKFRIRDFTINSSGENSTGVIAQEVQLSFPSMVSEVSEGILGVEEINPWLLVAGIQEQQVQITSLSNAVAGMNLASMQSVYDQFVTTLENLSMSTEDGALVVNTNLTVTGEALFNNATFTGNVEVGQVKIDSLENDISINTSPCVDLDGIINQETCDSNKLNLMQNKAGNIEMFDGEVKFKPNGEVLGEQIEAKTFKNTPSSAPEGTATCNSGEFKFAEDNGKAYVYFCTSNSEWVRSELSKF